MKYLDNIVREFFQQICFKLLSKRSKKCQMQFSFGHKTAAPGEARTHGLQIMRLTRCLLRYGGNNDISAAFYYRDEAQVLNYSMFH